MKKYLTKSLLLGLLLASLLLAACTPAAEPESGGSDQTTDASQTQPTETTADAAEGILSSFSTQTLTGESADSTILTGHPVTMVNVWATFCGPCIQEMPDLAALAA